MDNSLRSSVILLAGGVGSRMGHSIPKQFIPLKGKPIAHYSLDCFLNLPWVQEVIVVVEACNQEYFKDYQGKIRFAPPGKERQDSVYSGLKAVSTSSSWICIHDSARPFIQPEELTELFQEAKDVGAAALGVPVKFTIKECCPNQLVNKTLPRSQLWEIQTPQIISKTLLEQAFDFCISQKLQVTDDVSLVEHLNQPVKIVKGGYHNIKITTPEDLISADIIYSKIYGAV